MVEKTAIVTGANGNLGQAVVKKFGDNAYHVIGTVRHKQEQKTGDKKNAEEAELDLLHEEDCRKFVEEVIAKNNVIDVAVLTAGGFALGDIADTGTGDIAKQYQLNFETAYNMARPVLPDADFSAWVSPSEIAEVIYFYSGDEAASLREPVIKVYNRS